MQLELNSLNCGALSSEAPDKGWISRMFRMKMKDRLQTEPVLLDGCRRVSIVYFFSSLTPGVSGFAPIRSETTFSFLSAPSRYDPPTSSPTVASSSVAAFPALTIRVSELIWKVRSPTLTVFACLSTDAIFPRNGMVRGVATSFFSADLSAAVSGCVAMTVDAATRNVSSSRFIFCCVMVVDCWREGFLAKRM